ncbi:MAG: hypothetical protein ACXAB9_15355 [Candidatus Thorarchaeota archaeon]|jgi:hypothetical protein
MTLRELEDAIADILPEAEILEDQDGQVIIYTNKTMVWPDDCESREKGFATSDKIELLDFSDD